MGLKFSLLLILAAAADLAQSGPSGQAVKVSAEPPTLVITGASDSREAGDRVQKTDEARPVPGKADSLGKLSKVNSLTAEQQARFEAGKALYPLICGACHQPSGLGQDGLAPPLLGSEWAQGSERRLIRILLHGLSGPVTVKGKLYELAMPPLAVLEDEQIASLLTYVRREWGHAASAVDTVTVTNIRAETEKREEAWTEGELLKIP
jgi:mono/diheme cytochrome c family protein